MKLADVDDALYEALCERLVPAGFVAKKEDYSLVRHVHFGFQEVIYALYGYAPPFVFSFAFAIRFDAIHNLVAPFLGILPKSWDLAFTIHVNSTDLIGKELKPLVGSLEEVAAAVRTFDTFFQEYVIPFFDKHSSLEAAEYLLNHDPSYKTTGDFVQHAICGVAAAALCRRPDFNEIVARYREELSGYIKPARDRFEAAVAHVTAHALQL